MKHLLQSIIAVVLCACGFSAMAQMSYGGEPKSFKYTVSEAVPVIEIQPTDVAPLLAEDATIQKGERAYRIGVTHDVQYSMENTGRIDILPDGGTLWRLSYKCEGATFSSILFNEFSIPDGAELFFYTPDHEFVIGKFNNKNKMEDGTFFPQEIPGDQFFIEYYEPANAAFHGTLKMSRISQGYRDFFHIYDEANNSTDTDEDESIGDLKWGQPGEAEGTCHPNAICYDAQWHDQIMANVLYTMSSGGYIYMCSGSLVNNTARNGKQYMLSADHCYQSGSWTFYFKNHSASCSGTSAPTTYTASGSSAGVKARDNGNSSSDFMLVEISGTINPSYNVFLAGWTNTTAQPTNPSQCACIHHPGGDIGKCSIPVQIGVASGYTKFWATTWATATGTTEQGSSGSPLFNKDKLIVGQLYAGGSSCSSPTAADIYGKFSNSWTNNNNSSNAKKLKPWLDPINSGATSLQGEYLNTVGMTNFTQVVNALDVYPNPSNGNITVSGNFSSMNGTCNVYDMVGNLVYSSQITLSPEFTLNLNNLTNGMYMLEINDNNNVFHSKIIIGK